MLNFSYENQGTNSFLVYALKPDDSIDTVSSGMMSNNKIIGIVPFAFSQLDENRYFKYNITSKINLQQFFSGIVNKKRLIGVFLSMAEAVIAAEEYMLEVEKFVFNSEFIFVNVSTAEASMVYLPIMNSETETMDIRKFFKEILYGIQFDQTENCDYVAKILSFLNSNAAFSLKEFKKILEQILVVNSSPNTKIAAQNSVSNPIGGSGQQSAASASPQKNIPEQPNPQRPSSSTPPRQAQVPNIPVSPAPPVPPKGRVIVPAPSLHVGLEIPGSPMSVPQAGTSADNNQGEVKKGGMFSSLFRFKKKSAEKPKEKKLPKNKKNNKKVVQGNSSQPVPPPSPVNSTPIIDTPKISKDIINPIQQPIEGTTVLGASGAGETVCLDSNSNGKITPYLLRISTNEKALINKPLFRVGTEPNYADFVVNGNNSVSRSHADISLRNGEYFIRDNNSTNGTFINGERILSNSERKIVHEDKIVLANELFEFKMF